MFTTAETLPLSGEVRGGSGRSGIRDDIFITLLFFVLSDSFSPPRAYPLMSPSNNLITIRHPNGHEATVTLFGATVVSWKVNGDEKLFLSSKSGNFRQNGYLS